MMDPVLCVDLAVAACVGCAVWAWTRPRRGGLPRLPEPSRSSPALSVLTFLGRIVFRLGGTSEEMRNTLLYSGSRMTAETFVGLKMCVALGAGVAGALILDRVGEHNLLFVLLAAGLGFVLPDLWLRAKLRARQRAILRLLPDVIDLLSLCVNAGLDFLGAINRIVSVKEFRQEPLVEELAVALQEMKLGKRRAEAFKALARRVNVPELSSFVRTLVQADRMGTSVAEVLAIHSEDVRLQRFTRAERSALKAPIKILIPLIFCIMPTVAIIVGAPIFLQFMRQNPFAK